MLVKKLSILLAVTALALSSVSLVFARTAAEIRADITAIDAEIATKQTRRAELVAELNTALGTGTTTGTMVCTNLLKNIPGITVTTAEIKSLQKFLMAQGDLAAGKDTGLYDTDTVNAVKRFQERRGIVNGGTAETTGFGVVGPITRSAIRDISCPQSGTNTFSTDLRLVAPNTAAEYTQGSRVTIQWAQSTSDAVTIQLIRNRSHVATIAANVAADVRQFEWTIPSNLPSSNLYGIRVVKVRDTRVFDDSDTYFTIKGDLDLTAPDTAQTVAPGSQLPITWTASGRVQSVRIQLMQGETIVQTIATVQSGGSPYAWNIPAAIAEGSYKIRLVATNDATITDESTAAFSIAYTSGTAPAITAVTPAKTTYYQGESLGAISWTVANIPTTSRFKVELMRGDAVIRSLGTTTDSTTTSLTHNTALTDAPGVDYKIRVTDTANSNTTRTSAAFTIANQGLTLTAPNATGISVEPEKKLTITWDHLGKVNNVKIVLLKAADEVLVIKPSIAATTKTLDWDVPRDLAGNDFKIKIVDTSDATVTDTSDNPFTIAYTDATRPTINAVTLSRSIFDKGEPLGTINWTAANISAPSQFKAELYKGTTLVRQLGPVVGPATRSVVSSAALNDAAGTDYVIKVTDTTRPSVTASSSAFQIRGPQGFAVVSPNGGETITVGQKTRIEWTTSAIITRVKISLLKGTGASQTVTPIIASTVASNGYYEWTPGQTILGGSDYKIKIEDAGTSGASDESNATFTISYPGGTNPSIASVATPKAVYFHGEALGAITWTATSITAPSKIKVELYRGDTKVRDLGTVNAGVSTLQVSALLTDAPGTNYKIKVSDTNPARVSAFSPVFEVKNQALSLTAPNTAVVVQPGTTYTVTWDAPQGKVTTVRVALLKGTVERLLGSAPASGGSYSWKLPITEPVGNDYKIKIYDANEPAVSDISDTTFSIDYPEATRPSISGVTVAGSTTGSTFVRGTRVNIGWTAANLLGQNVKIELYRGRTRVASISNTYSATSGAFNQYLLPANLTAATNYRVVVTWTGTNANPSITASSPDFSVVTTAPAANTGSAATGSSNFWSYLGM